MLNNLNLGNSELFDIVVTTSNDWLDWNLALMSASMRGTISCLGFPGRNSAPGEFNPLDSKYFYAKQLRIESIGYSPEYPDSRGFLRFNEKDNMKYIINLILSNVLDPKILCAGEIDFTDLKDAYENLLKKEIAPLTYIVRWKH